MVALRTAVLKMIEALDKLDWDLFNKSSRDLNNIMDGMETVLEIIKVKKE